MKRLILGIFLLLVGCDSADQTGAWLFKIPEASWTRTCQTLSCTWLRWERLPDGTVRALSSTLEGDVENGPQACEWDCVYIHGALHHVTVAFPVNPAGCFDEPVVTLDPCKVSP